jgi:4-hydroxybenzoate polyprenyltransferase
MNWATALRLARVSLLPTVWTNALAGVALAGGSWREGRMALLLLGVSLSYIAGMFLNDAFDRRFDAEARPDRPIPAGLASAAQVFGAGWALLAAGCLALFAVGLLATNSQWEVGIAGLVLAALIVAYDAHHKRNPLSPLLMGACRMMVYIVAGFAVTSRPGAGLWLGAGVLLSYLIGLTYAAKTEGFVRLERAWPLVFLAAPLPYALSRAGAEPWTLLPLAIGVVWTLRALRKLARRQPGDVDAAVGAMLAGIAIVDAIVLTGCGELGLGLFALLLFATCWRLQRWVRGT